METWNDLRHNTILKGKKNMIVGSTAGLQHSLLCSICRTYGSNEGIFYNYEVCTKVCLNVESEGWGGRGSLTTLHFLSKQKVFLNLHITKWTIIEPAPYPTRFWDHFKKWSENKFTPSPFPHGLGFSRILEVTTLVEGRCSSVT